MNENAATQPDPAGDSQDPKVSSGNRGSGSGKKWVWAILTLLVPALFGFILLKKASPSLVVVGPESNLSMAEKRTLFDSNRHYVDYPSEAIEVCFILEPDKYDKQGEVYGEYVRFKAEKAVIEAFLKTQMGDKAPVEEPSPYSMWHYGIGNFNWWKPLEAEEKSFYEDKEKFITVDHATGTVFYSFVRSYSKLPS